MTEWLAFNFSCLKKADASEIVISLGAVQTNRQCGSPS